MRQVFCPSFKMLTKPRLLFRKKKKQQLTLPKKMPTNLYQMQHFVYSIYIYLHPCSIKYQYFAFLSIIKCNNKNLSLCLFCHALWYSQVRLMQTFISAVLCSLSRQAEYKAVGKYLNWSYHDSCLVVQDTVLTLVIIHAE